jgi:sugar lactone lactonase YvrE
MSILYLRSKKMNVRALKLKDSHYPDFHSTVDPDWDYRHFFETEAGRDYRENWISFDGVLADDTRNVIWCGVATFNGDIFHCFDRETRTFRSLDFQSVGDRYDAKFHRALLYDRDGIIWAATAMLHDSVQYFDAPGGAIVRFDPATETIEMVDRPLPNLYIQSLVADRERGILYGQTYLHDYLFRFDIDTRETRVLAHLGMNLFRGGLTQAENIAVDRNGTLWGEWAPNRAWGHSAGRHPYRLFRYHPDDDAVQFLDATLPPAPGSAGESGMMDSTVTGPDGAVYASTRDGMFCRIDPDRGEVETIAQPGSAKLRRLSAMISDGESRIFGIAGKGGEAELFSYEVGSGAVTVHGRVYDPEIDVNAWQIHDLALCDDGTLYAGENDVPLRSSYLWEISGLSL